MEATIGNRASSGYPEQVWKDGADYLVNHAQQEGRFVEK